MGMKGESCARDPGSVQPTPGYGRPAGYSGTAVGPGSAR